MPGDNRPWLCPRDHSCRSPLRHDDVRGYKQGCRSGSATAAAAAWKRDYEADDAPRRVPAAGTTRRLRALACLGWGLRDIGARLLLARSTVKALRDGIYDQASMATAVAVAEVYLELSETEPPPGRGASAARTSARKHRWRTVADWDGLDIDDPAVAPRADRPFIDRAPDLGVIDALAAGRLRWEDVARHDQIGAVEYLHRDGRRLVDVADALRAPVGDVKRCYDALLARAARRAATQKREVTADAA